MEQALFGSSFSYITVYAAGKRRFFMWLSDFLLRLNARVGDFVWGPIMIGVFLAEGMWFQVKTAFLPVWKWKLWMRKTILAAFFEKGVHESNDKGALSQFQSVCTALAATIGTGNIAGVATAITAGGPGAVFWMWISAVIGMATTYAENLLGIKYRYKDREGHYVGGAMVYMERGCKMKWMAVIFAFLCMLSSLGMGNMTQVNSVSHALESAFSVPLPVTGIVMAVIIGVLVLGGIGRIAKVTEKLIPIMGFAFIVGTVMVIGVHFRAIPAAVASIFREAFSFRAGVSGVAGYGIATAMRMGIARGIFTNEAGLGTSVMVNSVSDVKEPAEQGMWAIFTVFVDTIVMCTLAALAILVSGVYDPAVYGAALGTEAFTQLPDGAALTAQAFASAFGKQGANFVAISIAVFAFATLLAWSYYGEKSAEYIWGKKAIPVFKLLFIAATYIGSVMKLTVVWEISDTFNGLLAIPNLVALAILAPEVAAETRRYMSKKGEISKMTKTGKAGGKKQQIN